MKRPLVLALNPSIDAEWRVDGVRWEEKNNVLSERRWAGGKGVNVARWLNHLGARPQLILPLGGASGRELAALLRAEQLPATIIPLGVVASGILPDVEGGILPPGSEHATRTPVGASAFNIRHAVASAILPPGPAHATRVNVIVSTSKQGQLRFNPLGPELSPLEWQTTIARLRAALRRASCLILSGSLPRGVPVDAYAQLLLLACERRVPTLLDCDGPALAAAVCAKPFLVKPNEHELLEWFRTAGRSGAGRSGGLPRVPAGVTPIVQRAAWQLSTVTGGWVFVSRGAAPALLVHARDHQILSRRPPRVKPTNTVGAGDALLAAVAHQLIQGAPPAAWLQAGLATGSAATRLPAGSASFTANP